MVSDLTGMEIANASLLDTAVEIRSFADNCNMTDKFVVTIHRQLTLLGTC